MLYPDDKDAMQLLDRTEELISRSDEAWKKYLALPRDEEEERLAKDVATKRDAAAGSLRDRIKALRAGDRATADSIMEKRVSRAFRESNDTSLALSKKQLGLSKANYDNSQEAYARFRVIMMAAIALAQFERIAAGDLTQPVRIDRHGEMGRLLEGLARMQGALTDTVRRVRTGFESIGAATKQIAAGNAAVEAARAGEQGRHFDGRSHATECGAGGASSRSR